MSLTASGRRLALAGRSPEIDWRILTGNVPAWPTPPPWRPLDWSKEADHYPERGGSARLLEALCVRERAQGTDIGPESMIVTNGGYDALSLAARHLYDRGVRRAVCAGPILGTIARSLRQAGLEVVALDWDPFLADHGWMDMALGPEDLVYVNTPHNPTGACLPDSASRALLADRQRRGFRLVFDLIYDAFTFDPAAGGSPLAFVDDWHEVYAFNSFSKNYGAPGLRIGWLMAEPSATAELAVRLEAERIAVSAGAQERAADLCAYGNGPLVEAVRTGREVLLAWDSKHDLGLSRTQGGTQAWADLGIGDAESFADRLMAEDRIVLTTGANYFPVRPRHVRLPLGLPPDDLEEALHLITAARRRSSG
ncbi:beta-methylarginine biosynthesis bifunctional aminotransferase [Streptomyces sp. NPDC048297]|uniref:beta-methylarginine biosynthesis bifunctional aminotransferase n=1 Tax=Streptomyces sp. NPDC048297 TaxID=3365531 RepID=UPI0037188B72